MKTIFKYIFLLPALMLATSCEKDNYEEPEAGIFGQVYDHHGKPLQVAIGQGSMSIRIVERSYAQETLIRWSLPSISISIRMARSSITSSLPGSMRQIRIRDLSMRHWTMIRLLIPKL